MAMNSEGKVGEAEMRCGADAPAVAKVFMSGRSQAVRLPKAFRFDTDEVTIERRGDEIILRARPSKAAWWARMERILAGFEGMEPVERSHRLDAEDPPELGHLGEVPR